MSAPLKIAHRGYSAKYPENTLLAFEKALEHGAQGIELDVHCSIDGIPMVIHDETVNRTTDGRGAVEQMTLAQLKSLHIEGGQSIPILDEVLHFTRGKTFLFIELKAECAVLPVVQMLNRLQYGSKECMLISFEHGWLAEIKQRFPQLSIGLTFENLPPDFVERAKKSLADAVLPCISHATHEKVRAAQEVGLAVYTWTCNSDADIAHAKSIGVNGIMSDWVEKL